MKISTTNAARLITQFENAVRTHELKGAQHPADHAEIERKYQQAKRSLKRFCIECVIGEDK